MSVWVPIRLSGPLQPHALELSGFHTGCSKLWFLLHLQAKPKIFKLISAHLRNSKYPLQEKGIRKLDSIQSVIITLLHNYRKSVSGLPSPDAWSKNRELSWRLISPDSMIDERITEGYLKPNQNERQLISYIVSFSVPIYKQNNWCPKLLLFLEYTQQTFTWKFTWTFVLC